jgi:hypothetical protein
MSSESYVSKLMSGSGEIPARTRWWPRHSKDMTRFLLLAGTPDRRAMLSHRQLLMSGALEWDETVCGLRKEGPMSDHAKLEIALVEAAIKTDLVRIRKIGESLTKNVQDIVDASTIRSSEIPTGRLRVLLAQHVGSFVESVMQYMDENEKKFMECEHRRNDNTLALAAFATEWV